MSRWTFRVIRDQPGIVTLKCVLCEQKVSGKNANQAVARLKEHRIDVHGICHPRIPRPCTR